MAAQSGRALPDAGADGGDQVARPLGRDHGGVESTTGGAEETAPGRQQVDRHRRHVPFRALSLQSGTRTHTPGPRATCEEMRVVMSKSVLLREDSCGRRLVKT